ncbi:MAG: hypothetical protein E7425_07385 [Ruminococcaceae bacterium]|nr:hypothetical protein [Oscillospiraceae bacterium]
MLDKNDLQAIAELITASEERIKAEMGARMSAEIAASEERTAKRIEEASRQAVRDAVSQAVAYSEGAVETKLDAIREGLDLALEVHIPVERIDRIEENITALKVVVRKHSEDIEKLKKAQ